MSVRPKTGALALAAALALSVGFAGVAVAQTATGSTGGSDTGGDRTQMLFKRIDADANGSISQEEIDTWRSAAVFRMDGDGDGKVTKDEVDAHLAQRQAQGSQTQDSAGFFQTYDANSDGSIDKDELKNGGSKRFQTADTDANGELSMEEWQALSGS